MSDQAKAAPSAQQAAGSIDTPAQQFPMLWARPVLYTDTLEGNQTCRDDLWAVTTQELSGLLAAATPAQPIAPAHIERFSIYEDHGRANMMGDDDGEYVLYSDHIEALGTVAQPIAVSAPKLPDGWVALSITWDEGYPEEVAFGPQHLMDRLKKKLDKYYAGVIAARNSQAAAVSAPTDELALKMLNSIALWWHADRLQVVDGDPAAFEKLMESVELFMLQARKAPTVEKLMADMDTMRDEFADLSRALSFWLPRVPAEPGPIQDRVVRDAYFLTDGPADDKCAEELGWITLNVASRATAPSVSAPTDDDLHNFIVQNRDSAMSMFDFRTQVKAKLAARASAPVSGPSDA